jgi:hypothetical protein
VSKAADALGVSKVTIYAKLRSWGMHPRDRDDGGGGSEGREGPVSARWSYRAIPVAEDLSGPATPHSVPAPSSEPRRRAPSKS